MSPESQIARTTRFISVSTWLTITYGFEQARLALVPSSDVINSSHTLKLNPLTEFIPRLDPLQHQLLYPFLQHCGDVMDTAFVTAGALAVLSAVSLAAPRLSERVRLGLSFLAGAAVVTAWELIGQKPDILDIPAGLVGAAGVVGAYHLANRMLRS